MDNSEYSQFSCLNIEEICNIVNEIYVSCKYNKEETELGKILKEKIMSAEKIQSNEELIKHLHVTPRIVFMEMFGINTNTIEDLYYNFKGVPTFSNDMIRPIFVYNDRYKHGKAGHIKINIENLNNAKMFLHKYYGGKYSNMISRYTTDDFYSYSDW